MKDRKGKVIFMNELKDRVVTMKLKTGTNKQRLHQTDAREYKELLHELFMEKLKELDFDITLVENGFIIEVSNDEYGAIPVEAKFVIKPLDFDVIAANDQYNEKIERAKQRAIDKKNKRTA